jgi:hypothetical protein
MATDITASRYAYEQFVVYAVILALAGLASTLVGIAAYTMPGLGERLVYNGISVHRIWALAWGVPTLVAFGTALALPRSKAAWVFDLVLIALGLFSIVLIPFCAPLLKRWVQPETEAYFEMEAKEPTMAHQTSVDLDPHEDPVQP